MFRDFFAGNPSFNFDPHQQITGLNANQMIQFPKAIGLEVSLATSGMLDDLFLTINSKVVRGGAGAEGVGLQCPSASKTRSTVAESVAPRSYYSFPTESVASNFLPDIQHQQLCLSRQSDGTLGFSQTQVIEFAGSDSLETFGQNRSDARKKLEFVQMVTGRSTEPNSARWFRRRWLCL